MLKNPAEKYRPFHAVRPTQRQWPDRRIERAPIWMSTDLRDGNQALFDPMDAERKLRLFDTLVDIGFKQIEVAFPSASQTEFGFVRRLIEEQRIPSDVSIEVVTPAREALIRRSFESLRGARQAIMHVYNATAPIWRERVFGMSRAQIKQLAVDATRLIRQLAEEAPETDWRFEYSPETFMATEADFALDVCNAVVDAWNPSPAKPMILNLPTTVEIASPNVFADQIEWMHTHLARRDSIVLSVHPHNDRGTAVASAELALMAGAQRVEGCLFGNGERTGNVDLVTLALNLYTQGVDPCLDFSDINAIARVFESCTQQPVHARHPYVGDLVFTAFSGSHQDAIRKGFGARQADGLWEVPYLPIDPADLGRSYDSVVRVNSQSGKGGIAFLVEKHYGIHLPRRMQIEFSAAVQRVADARGGELESSALVELFEQLYLGVGAPWQLRSSRITEDAQGCHVDLELLYRAEPVCLHGRGAGPVAAAVDAFNRSGRLQGRLRVDHFDEQSLGNGADALAMTLIEVAFDAQPARFGAGRHASIVEAALQALVCGLNRLT